MTLQAVSEFPATAPEQIEHFAKLLNRSEEKRQVFAEIYRGQSQKPKTAAEIAKKAHLTAKRVLEIATPLAANHLFEKLRVNNLTAYKKYPNINTVKKKILKLATNAKQLREHVTVRKPKIAAQVVKIQLAPKSKDVVIDVRHVTIDDIDNFCRVRSLPHHKVPSQMNPARLPEAEFKSGIKRILGNKGAFQDWGGERNDLYTTHLKIKGNVTLQRLV